MDGEKGFCVFHDEMAWETLSDEIRQKIGEKLIRVDYNFDGYHISETDLFSMRGVTLALLIRTLGL